VTLILTASFGHGHHSAAWAVYSALREIGHPAAVIDLPRLAHPRLADWLSRAYAFLIVHFPQLWHWGYRALAEHPLEKRPVFWQKYLFARLKRLLEQEKPALIISTFPLYGLLLQALEKQGIQIPPVITVITDSVSIHPIWAAGVSHLYAVADEESDQALQKLGIPASRTSITGFPVSLQFMQKSRVEERNPSEQPHLLYLPSTPGKHVQDTLQSLCPLLSRGMRLTVVAGRHYSRLHHRLQRFSDAAPARQVQIFSWSDEIPELLRTADAVITKAGGAIVHEVMAAQVPAILDNVVPGQEQGNAHYLLSKNAALRSTSAQETASLVEKLFYTEPKLASSIRTALSPLSVPDAALRIVHEAEARSWLIRREGIGLQS
jgi:processive 1,2-diacylglycerol beta-glucosyltransferase